MWRVKTAEEKLAERKSRRLRQIALAAAVWAVLLYVVASSPLWHGRILGGLVLPIPRLVPDAFLYLALGALALGIGFLAFRSRASRNYSVMICQKCSRLKMDDGQAHCVCGGEFLSLSEMKWVSGPAHPENLPVPPQGPDPKNPAPSLKAAR